MTRQDFLTFIEHRANSPQFYTEVDYAFMDKYSLWKGKPSIRTALPLLTRSRGQINNMVKHMMKALELEFQIITITKEGKTIGYA